MSFYASTATFFLLHCDEWDRVVAMPRHKFVTGATLLQLKMTQWFVTRVTWQVPHVVQELPTLPEHISSPPDIVGSCCLFFSFCSFVHCVVCSPSIYDFWLPPWYLQTFLKGVPYNAGDISLKSVERFDHMMFVCRFQASRSSKPSCYVASEFIALSLLVGIC